MTITLDIEASSLSPDSYPIQVGYTIKNGNSLQVKEQLIKPLAEWTDWDEEAELYVHNISRIDIENGLDIHCVCKQLNKDLCGETVIVDSLNYDEFWLGKLFDAANMKIEFSLIHVDKYLLENFNIPSGSFEDEREFYTFEHQAGDDSKMILKIIENLTNQSPA